MTFRPVYFLLGFVLSLTGLSVLGSILVPGDLTARFTRFHVGIGIDRNFFPTGNDIRGILRAGWGRGEAVTVIIGGTSVLQGVSQAEPAIWSEELQRLLGRSYRVINLAQRAGRPNDFGNIAAEMLLKRNKPVLYVSDSMPNQFTIPIEASFYKKVVFNAWEHGALLDWPARDAKMRAALWSSDGGFRGAAWEGLLDRALNFDELWTYIAFEKGGLVWDKSRGLDSAAPLRLSPDPELSAAWHSAQGYPTGDDDRSQMKFVEDSAARPPETILQAARDGIEEQFPTALRAQSFVLVNLNSPRFIDRLDEAERSAFRQRAEDVATLLKEMGFAQSMVLTDDFTEADYHDRVHLSVQGGKKLAERMAPEIVRLAKQKGYVQ